MESDSSSGGSGLPEKGQASRFKEVSQEEAQEALLGGLGLVTGRAVKPSATTPKLERPYLPTAGPSRAPGREPEGYADLDPEDPPPEGIQASYLAKVKELEDRIAELQEELPKPLKEGEIHPNVLQLSLTPMSSLANYRWFPWNIVRDYWPDKNCPVFAWRESVISNKIYITGREEEVKRFVQYLIQRCETQAGTTIRTESFWRGVSYDDKQLRELLNENTLI